MKKYIRTQDGRIVDVGAFIENEKTSKYYKDHIFHEIENRDDECFLHWTATGTEDNPDGGQRSVRCDFEAYVTSPFVEQADTIEELCDEFVIYETKFGPRSRYICPHIDIVEEYRKEYTIFGANWTDKGLIYVAKMNEKGEFELL